MRKRETVEGEIEKKFKMKNCCYRIKIKKLNVSSVDHIQTLKVKNQKISKVENNIFFVVYFLKKSIKNCTINFLLHNENFRKTKKKNKK